MDEGDSYSGREALVALSISDNLLEATSRAEANEIVEDITVMEDASSPASTILEPNDGVPKIKARPYQKEMLEESLRKNIIVAVS